MSWRGGDKMTYRTLIALLGVLTFMPGGSLSASPAYAAVIGVDSASALGANDAIGWGQINLPAGQAVQVYTGPLSVVSTNGNGATLSVADDNVFVRVDQAPGGDYYGNFPPGMQLIVTCANCPSVGSFEAFVINFNQLFMVAALRLVPGVTVPMTP
jgi:hypothetical protein